MEGVVKARLGLRADGVDVSEMGEDGFLLCSLKFDGSPSLHATIDVKGRRFRSGIAYSGEFIAPLRAPTGRGWLERLINEAAAHLLAVKAGES
jgi:hypothetical protein